MRADSALRKELASHLLQDAIGRVSAAATANGLVWGVGTSVHRPTELSNYRERGATVFGNGDDVSGLTAMLRGCGRALDLALASNEPPQPAPAEIVGPATTGAAGGPASGGTPAVTDTAAARPLSPATSAVSPSVPVWSKLSSGAPPSPVCRLLSTPNISQNTAPAPLDSIAGIHMTWCVRCVQLED